MSATPELARFSPPVRILLIEDDPDCAALLQGYLRAVPWAELALDTVGTLGDAIARLAHGNFDLVIADLNLPDSIGIATLEGLARATDRLIIAITGDDDPALHEQAIVRGAFLHKRELGAAELERLVRLASMQANTFRCLRESEGRFRSLIQLSSDWYWEQDDQFTFTFQSTRFSEKTGLAPDRYVGTRRWDRPALNLTEADWDRHRAQLARQEPFRDFEIHRETPDGRRVWLSISGEPVFDAAGGFEGYRGIGRNITESKREERLLALEHAIVRDLADAASVSAALGVVMRAICQSEDWDCGRYFQLDEAAGVMRCEESWSVGAGPLARFAESSRGRAFERGIGLVGHVWQTGEPLWISDVTDDSRVLRSPRVREAGGHGACLFPVTLDNKVTGVLSISSIRVREPDERLLETMRVIGSQVGQFLQRKQAEAALSASEARFRQTYELAATGIANVSLDGRFLRVNRRLCEILGYSERELLGRSAKDISHPEDRDAADAQRARLRRGELESLRLEKRYLRKDGTVVWVSVTIALARSAEGEPQYEISVMEDVTERKEREAELRRFRTALDASDDMVFLFNLRDGRLLDFNQTACDDLGYTREELLRMRPEQLRADVTAEGLKAEVRELLSRGASNTVLTEYRRKDGSSFPVESQRHVQDTPQGRVLVVNARDLTERRRAEERQAAHLRYQEKIARFGEAALAKREAGEVIAEAVQAVLEGLGGGVVAYVERCPGERCVMVRAVAGLARQGENSVAAYGAEQAIAAVLEHGEPATVTAEDPASLPFWWASALRNAVLVPVLDDQGPRGALCALSESPLPQGLEESRFVVAAASILSAALQRLDSENRLAFLAQFDALTGLPNRALLSDRFSQMIVQARRHDSPLGVLFIDLDDFKLVNDTLGHAGGDELLKEVALRLEASIRLGDTIARIAGDEFAVILGDLKKPDDAALVAQKIIDRLAAPVWVCGQEVFVTASIGISAFPSDGDDAETLLGAADAAMYGAKQSGRNAYQFFTAEINARIRARAQLGSELRRALERDEFALVYQPKYDLRTRRICAAEALLRWRHPTRGVVLPLEFIPVLEETGLIVAVGEWVLRRACADLKAWQAAGLDVVPIAVNLSARQFRQQDLDTRIRDLVRSAGVDPRLIELEITESQLMQDPHHAIRVMRALSQAGIRMAIDDFGTGYSSLSYLTRFPVAALKIDQSFVADILRDDAAAAIARTIIDMAHTLGFTVIAEGVETEAQAVFLRELNCEQAQGNLFARPMAAADLAVLLAAEALAAAPTLASAAVPQVGWA